MPKKRIKRGHKRRTLLDMILDRVKSRQHEVTIDTEGYTKETVDRIKSAAKERGFHTSSDGRFILIRDLRDLRDL